MHGDMIIGAPGATNSSGVATGRAYLFRRNSGGNLDAWEYVETFDHSSGVADSRFGSNVALNDSFAFVCALNDTNSSGGNGQVWSIELGRSDAQPQVVRLPKTGRNDVLKDWGVGLDYQDDVLGIGGPTSERNGTATGVAAAYPCVNGVPQATDLIVPPAEWALDNANFGQSITYSSGQLMIGVPIIGAGQGSVLNYLEDKVTGNWLFNEAILDADDALVTLFGWSVAIHGDLMVVGAPMVGWCRWSCDPLPILADRGQWVLEHVLNPEVAAVADWSAGPWVSTNSVSWSHRRFSMWEHSVRPMRPRSVASSSTRRRRVNGNSTSVSRCP